MSDLTLPAPLPASDNLKASLVVDAINGQRGAILDLNKRVAEGVLSHGERLENIERRVADAAEQLRKAKDEAALSALGAHAGLPDSEVSARYMTPRGLRLSAGDVSVKLPSGKSGTVRAWGYLDDPTPVNAEQVEAQRAYRALALAGSIMKQRGERASELVDTAYTNLMRVLAKTPAASLSPQVRAILDGSAASGLEMLAVPTLSALREPVRLQRRLAGLIRVRTQVSDSWKEVSEAGNAVMRKRSTRTDDPARYERSRFTTSDNTISAHTYVAQTLIDDNLLSNPAAIVSITDRAMAFLDRMEADTLEIQVLHSDNAGSHQDTVSTWTLGGYLTAGDLDGTDSPVRQWVGWRARAFDDSTTASAGGSFDETDWFGTIKLMGNRAVSSGLVAVCGIGTYFSEILPNAKFINRDYVGDRATLITGQVTDIGGVPLILSEFMADEYETSGLYTGGGGVTGQIVVADPSAYAWDMVPAMEGDWEVNEQHRGAVYIGRKRTYRLTATCLSTDKPTALIRNL